VLGLKPGAGLMVTALILVAACGPTRTSVPLGVRLVAGQERGGKVALVIASKAPLVTIRESSPYDSIYRYREIPPTADPVAEARALRMAIDGLQARSEALDVWAVDAEGLIVRYALERSGGGKLPGRVILVDTPNRGLSASGEHYISMLPSRSACRAVSSAAVGGGGSGLTRSRHPPADGD
jgi:hypothetical protein